jgi:hypothetical protein
MTLVVRQSMKTIDSMAKTSDKLGIATERLAGLHHAAGLAGVAVRKFDMGIQRMTRRVAEAAQDTGEAKAAIKELGLSAKALARMAPEDQFSAIADAMEKVSSQGDRVRLGFKLFDSEGVALINVLRGGSKALQAAQADAEALGLTFTRKMAAKVEMANDAMLRLKAVMAGAGRTIAIELAPYVQAIAEYFIELRTHGLAAGISVSTVLEQMASSAANVFTVIDKLKIGFKELRLSALLQQQTNLRTRVGYSAYMLSFLGIDTPLVKVKERLENVRLQIKELTAEIAADTIAVRDEDRKRGILAWIKEVKERADEIAEAITKAIEAAGGAFGARMPIPAMAQRIGFAREIDPSTTSIAGLAMAGKKEQKVHDQAAVDELKKHTAILKGGGLLAARVW